MTKRKAKIIKDPKVRGEWVESVFMARAGEQGLAVSKPWGDSNTFDFVVGRPGNFVSVQVKSTVFASGGGYPCAVKKQNRAYARGSFDFLAAYVVLEDVWYIIPADKLVGKESVVLCSKAKQANYEEYREAWDLLRKASAAGEATGIGTTKSSGGSVEEEAVAGTLTSRPTSPPTSQPTSHPTNALGRMEAAANYVRRYLEGSHVRPQKDTDEI